MSLAALGAIAGGLNQGMDLAQRDQELKAQKDLRDKQQKALEEDREYMKTQRDLQASQTKRLLEKQARQDQYEADASKVFDPVSETSSGPAPSYDAALSGGVTQPTTTTRQPTQLEVSQRLLQAQKNAQMVDQAAATQDKINKIFTDVDRQNYNTLLQSSQGMSFDDLADRASQLVTADNSPLMVGDKQRNSDGSYTFNIRSRLNGASMPFTAKNSQDLLDGLRYHMDYEQYAAEAKARRELKNKLAEQRPAAVGANGALVPDGQGGWIKVPGTAAPNGQSTAAQSGAGGKAVDPNKQIADALDFLKPTLKDLTPDVVAKVQQFTYQVVSNSNGRVPPQLAATIALDAATNPDKLQPRLDLSSGSIDMVYESPEAGEIKFTRGYATPAQQNGLKPEQLKGFAVQLVAAQPAAVKDKLVAAAFDASGVARRDLETGIKSEIAASYAQKLKLNPGAKAQIEAERDATIQSTMASLGRKLDLVSGYYPKPKANAPAPSIRQPAGLSIEANKYAGMNRRQMDELDAAEARKWREANPRPQADPQARAQLAALEQQRSALIRQGKVVDANAVTEKIRALKKQSGL